jgi:hypothetical protein
VCVVITRPCGVFRYLSSVIEDAHEEPLRRDSVDKEANSVYSTRRGAKLRTSGRPRTIRGVSEMKMSVQTPLYTVAPRFSWFSSDGQKPAKLPQLGMTLVRCS